MSTSERALNFTLFVLRRGQRILAKEWISLSYIWKGRQKRALHCVTQTSLSSLFHRLVFAASLRRVIEIPIRSQFPSSFPCSFSSARSAFSLLSASGRSFLRLRIFLPSSRHQRFDHPRPVRETVSLLHEANWCAVRSFTPTLLLLSVRELQRSSDTNVFSWPFEARMAGNWVSEMWIFKCRPQCQDMFAYLDAKKLNTFFFQKSLLFILSATQRGAAYRIMFYPSRILIKNAVWLFHSEFIIMNTEDLRSIISHDLSRSESRVWWI